MPRPEILEGCGRVVKCNLSMTQITDSDALKQVSEAPFQEPYSEEIAFFWPCLLSSIFCKFFVKRQLCGSRDLFALALLIRHGTALESCLREPFRTLIPCIRILRAGRLVS